MARRGLWVIGGVAVGVSAIVLTPESRTWLRRRLGLEAEDRRWFEEESEEQHAEHEGDEPLDTREARFSLRARLAEEGNPGPAAAPPEEPTAAPAPPPPPAEPAFPAFEQAAPEPPAAPSQPWRPAVPVFPAFDPPAPAPPPAPEPAAYESVPPVSPEADAPKTPGEDTNEIEPLPSASAAPAPAEEPPPLPPPTLLRPPAPPPPSRPFSGEGASFRSAIDAARERVHGAAREATPDEGESTEPLRDRDA
jgi:hypothetical protein